MCELEPITRLRAKIIAMMITMTDYPEDYPFELKLHRIYTRLELAITLGKLNELESKMREYSRAKPMLKSMLLNSMEKTLWKNMN